MLVKNEKKFCDAHFHYTDCVEQQALDKGSLTSWIGCTCAHSKTEWEVQKLAAATSNLILSYGLHPQSAGNINIKDNLDFLENLLLKNELKAIGETGFDLFTDEYKEAFEKQEQIFNEQIALALQYQVPVVIHCRRANEKLFEYSKLLKKLPSVLFHSFMGTPIEAQSLLNKGINGYFSFGKQTMNNNKKVIACVKDLPLDRLLCETDAPYQHLKNESKTFQQDIITVYDAFYSLRKETEEEINSQFYTNFKNLFLLAD